MLNNALCKHAVHHLQLHNYYICYIIINKSYILHMNMHQSEDLSETYQTNNAVPSRLDPP